MKAIQSAFSPMLRILLTTFIMSIHFAVSSISAAAGTDPLAEIFGTVDKTQLMQTLKKLTGYEPVTVDHETFSISERYSPAGKARFRKYWKSYFQSLGLQVNEQNYPTRHSIGESEGHNLEAILPGRSKDSVVIIVHYDSMGPWEHETENPGVDDDMTGMAIMLETARILKNYPTQPQYTVRFVAADYEEHAYPGLEGARQYAKALSALAKDQNFKLIAAVDNEQSGWNCAAEGACGDDSKELRFDIFSCSGDSHPYDSKELGNAMEAITRKYSSLQPHRDCLGAHSDHYAMWEIGVPALAFSEHSPFDNPHFDHKGGDVLETIDPDYFHQIAQVGVTFATTLCGLNP